MASATKITMRKAKMKHKKAGHKRKMKTARKGTTPTQANLFQDTAN